MSLDPGGRAVALYEYGGTEVSLWNVETGRREGPPIEVEKKIARVVVVPGDKAVAVIEEEGSLQIFDIASGQPMGPAATPPREGAYVDLRVVDGKFLVLLTGTNDRQQRIWQLLDGTANKPLGSFADPEYTLRAAELDPAGLRMLGAGMDGRAHVILMRGVGQELAEPVPHRGNHLPIFRPDGRQIATQFDRRTIVLRHAVPSVPGVRTLLATRGAHEAVLSPDGAVGAVRRSSNSIQLFDAASGAARGSAMLHADLLASFAFSRDAQRLATASADGTARVWSAVDGTAVTELVHDGPVNTVEFSPVHHLDLRR